MLLTDSLSSLDISVIFALAVASFSFVSLLLPVVKKLTSKKDPSKLKKKKSVTCPFSKGSNFLVETAEHLPPSPLDLFDEWVKDDAEGNTRPLAARWLNAGLSGQDTPGMLRAGLKRLRNSRHFLVLEPHRLKEELLLKKKALDDPKRHPIVFVAEEDSLEAQRECLDLFLSYLPKRYPEQYVYSKRSGTITVKAIDTTFSIDDWINTRPLELCERIVQEDLILMRPQMNPATENSPPTETYHMAAAAVVFSFNELSQKLGKPAEWIHAPVPGFEKFLRKSLNITFSKLEPEQPLWRNNWGIAPSGTLDEPLYGSTAAQEHRTMTAKDIDVPGKFLKVEYQTIRRFPKSKYLLFTVKTMADPMYELEKVPKAAGCLAASIRGMSPAMRKYKGIENDVTCEAVLSYLDSICPPPSNPSSSPARSPPSSPQRSEKLVHLSN